MEKVVGIRQNGPEDAKIDQRPKKEDDLVKN